MDPLLDQLISELKEKHGDELDLENHHYFLFYKDGVFDIYFDQDEKELKVDVTLSEGIKTYHTDKKIVSIMKES